MLANNVLKIILIFAIFLGFCNFSYAETLPTVNAGVVSDVWYSSPDIREGDMIKIYSGIYNSSNIKIIGNASYFIDSQEVQKVWFTSEPKSLIQIEAPWTALAGDHNVQVKVSTSTANLSKAESSEGWISVQRRITKESLQKDTQNIIDKAVKAIDPMAEKLATNIERFGNNLTKVQSKNKTTPTATTTAPTTFMNKILKSALDGSAYLVRHWGWTSLGIIVLYFIIRRRREKKSWW